MTKQRKSKREKNTYPTSSHHVDEAVVDIDVHVRIHWRAFLDDDVAEFIGVVLGRLNRHLGNDKTAKQN